MFRFVTERSKFAVAALLFLFSLITAANSISAATYTVTTIADSGAGSLRQAVLDANGAAANDIIVFNIPPATCPAVVCTITLTSEIVIANNGSLTISGTGANRLTISGGTGTNRIFSSSGATLTVAGITLTGGGGTGATSSGNGGAIYAGGGTLVLRGVNITGNAASGTGVGGGVRFVGGTNHQITNSTFSGNSGSACAGFNNTGTLTVTNLTVSGNTTTGTGGGFCNDTGGTMIVNNSTISGNTGGQAGGFYNAGTLTITNTIVAGNTAGARADIFQNGGTLTSAGENLIGSNESATVQFPAGNPNANNDIAGTSGSRINPLLDVLANYGGTIPTRRPQPASPAIDGGSAVAGASMDARGVIRPFDDPSIANATGGNGADIGAFELQTSSVKTWGRNSLGLLGLGNTNDPWRTPQTVTGFDDIVQYGGGGFHSVALRSDGTVVTARRNQDGELGTGETQADPRDTFGPVINLINIVQVTGGIYHSMALKGDGSVWVWGNGRNGQLGTGFTVNIGGPGPIGLGISEFYQHVIAIAAGSYHSLALTDDGKVWAWGNNTFGQIGDGLDTTIRLSPTRVLVAAGGEQLSGVIAIAAGYRHSVALKADGTVWVWGKISVNSATTRRSIMSAAATACTFQHRRPII
jgi:hypothetical protein